MVLWTTSSQFLAYVGGFPRNNLEEWCIAVSPINHAWGIHKRCLYLSKCLSAWLWIRKYWSRSFSKCLRIWNNWIWHLGWVPVCWLYHLYEYISSRGCGNNLSLFTLLTHCWIWGNHPAASYSSHWDNCSRVFIWDIPD